MSIRDFEEFKRTLKTRLRYQEVGGVKFWLSPEITDDLDAYLDQLCARYLAGTETERRELCELFIDPEACGYLHDYIPRATARIKPPQAKEFLLSGLTAVALTEAGCDYRDTQYELGYLFRAAQNAGIRDPLPEFLQIAQTLESKDDRSVGWLMAHVKESGAYRELRVCPSDEEIVEIIKRGDLIGLRNLIAAGTNVSQRDHQGLTLLMKAAQTGNVKIVSMLIAAGADLDVADDEGKSALVHAALKSHWATLEALLRACANHEVKIAGKVLADFLAQCAQQQNSPRLDAVLELLSNRITGRNNSAA